MLALTHLPSSNLVHGERTHVARLAIDHELAIRQHHSYCGLLAEFGARVVTLNINQEFPDSTFIEDTAVVLDEVAVLASMGAQSRRGEVAGMEAELRKYREVRCVEGSATIEGGDVLQVGRRLLVGISSRTNAAGVRALEEIAGHFGYQVLPVPVRQCLHLKTAVTALPDGRLLLNPSWLDVAALPGFEVISVPEQEPWAANTLSIGGVVCISAEHKHTVDLLRHQGFTVRTVCLSEFAKAEGCVTCLSILINEKC